jgi:hypothetical protein
LGKLYWFKFVPGDWLKDPELRSVSSGARGLWIDMLSLMFDSVRRGYLQLNNGNVVTAELLARMTGNSTDDCSHWLQELEYSGVLSRTDDGCIFNRRMVKEQRERSEGNGRVAKHRNKTDVTPHVTGDVTPVSNSNSVSVSAFEFGSKDLKPKDSDELIETIAKSHPANWREKKELTFIPPAQCDVIMKAIIRDGPELVKQGTLAYARAVNIWPQSERQYVLGIIKFYDRSEYLKDPKEWERSSGTGNKNRVSAAAERQSNTQQAIINSITNLARTRDGDHGGEQQDRSDAGIERRTLPAVRGTSAGGH